MTVWHTFIYYIIYTSTKIIKNMKKLLLSISLLILTLIGFSQAETAEMSDYEKYRLQKDIEEHSTLYDKTFDTTFIDTAYVFDTVYVKDNKKSATVINNYYENEDYGYDRPDVRFNLCFGYNWFYSPWYSWYYDPWFYDPWYYSPWYFSWYYPYHSYWYTPYYGYPYYGYHGYNDWGYNGHHNNSYHQNNNYTYGPRNSRHDYNVTRPTSTTSRPTSISSRPTKTYVDQSTKDAIKTIPSRSNSISSRTMNTTRPITTNRSPYTKVLEQNKSTDTRIRDYTPTYTKPRTSTYTRPTYNSSTNRSSSTTYRSSTPIKSTNSYNRPTSTYRSSGSSGSSTYRSSTPTRSSSSYSGGSRSTSGSSTYRSSGSTPSRSSSSYSGKSPSGGSSHSSSPRR